ncbi:MAG: anti-virulence regulator CigR family protein [Gemmatimonadota bacterium]|nr:anti-virulence regulator CigR family protein [Gemmatimonadota bacterium]
MRSLLRGLATCVALALALVGFAPLEAAGQGRGNGPASSQGVTFSVDVKAAIGQFYASHASPGAQALPPGIRKRLERGKPLPPGIAKRTAPPELRAAARVPEGYELVEVGLDVLLVEVATSVIHDVLMDVVR